ncbi:hypothetical protein ACIPSJ_01645 [Streptomyces sp. NPDC090088]|uniref:hypothetical protein n=1 Tax=Streptomyces sp. NPDC090088 TaxID=3365944 RepID=UPI0037F50A65
MTVKFWSAADGEWRTLGELVAGAFEPLGSTTEAMVRASAALERFKEAIQEAGDRPAPVPVITLPSARLHTPELVWPYQYGKGTVEVAFDGPVTRSLRTLFEPLFLAADVWQERRLARIAEDLGLHPRVARLQFDGVRRVLEAAGIGDGYGRLTIRQPVRPPVELPTVLELTFVYPDPLDWQSTSSRPLTMRSLPRASQ